MNDPYNPSGGGGYPGGGYQGPGYPGGGYQGPGYPGGGNAPQQDYLQRGYLQGGPVDFQGAIRQQFQNIMNFNGRASRPAFWWYVLPAVIIDIIAFAALPSAVYYIIALVVGLSYLSLGIRRLHDIDKSGWWCLLGFIPIVGGIILIVWACQAGTPGPNRFG